MLECNKGVFADASVEPLQLKGNLTLMYAYHKPKNPFKLNSMSRVVKLPYYKAVREASELLGVLRVPFL